MSCLALKYAVVAQWLKEHSVLFNLVSGEYHKHKVGHIFLYWEKHLAWDRNDWMNEWLTEALDEFYPTFEYWRSTLKSNYGSLH